MFQLLQSYPSYPDGDPHKSEFGLKAYTVDQAWAMVASAYYLQEHPEYAFNYAMGIDGVFDYATNLFYEETDLLTYISSGYSNRTQVITTYALFLYHTVALESAYGVFTRDLAQKAYQPIIDNITEASGYLWHESDGSVDILTNIWAWFMLRTAITSLSTQMIFGGVNESVIGSHAINDIASLGVDIMHITSKMMSLRDSIISMWNGYRFPARRNIDSSYTYDDTLRLVAISGLFWYLNDRPTSEALLTVTDSYLTTSGSVSGYCNRPGEPISIEMTLLTAILHYKLKGRTMADLTVLSALNARQVDGSWVGLLTPNEEPDPYASISSTVWPVLYYHAKHVLFN